jgi:hypothetical protein
VGVCDAIDVWASAVDGVMAHECYLRVAGVSKSSIVLS